MDGPTNLIGSRGVIDYSGRLVTNDNIRFALALGYCYRFAHRFIAVQESTSVRVLFDPSMNGAHPGNVYKLKGGFIAISNPVNVKLYENPVVSSNGTEITMFNFNRVDGDPSLNTHAKLYHGPTIDSSGNAYGPDLYIYAGEGAPGLSISSPGFVGDNFSVHLNPNRKYLWEMQNLVGDETDILIYGRLVYEPDYRTGGR